MKTKKTVDIRKLFSNTLGSKINDFTLPPHSFKIMECKLIEYHQDEKALTIKLPILKKWLNPYGSMQGGMIGAAIDNAVGPLSILIASINMTRSIETKFIKTITMDTEFIYVKAKLTEQKKRRLIFEAEVHDANGVVYATSKVVNFVL